MVVEQPETIFQRRWKQLRQRFGGSPMFKRLEVACPTWSRHPVTLLFDELHGTPRVRFLALMLPFAVSRVTSATTQLLQMS